MTWANTFGGVLRGMSNVANGVAECIKSWVPMRVLDVWHWNNAGIHEHEFMQLYQGAEHWWHWPNGHHRNMFAPSDGYYLIHTWGSEKKHKNYHFLSAKMLSTALQVRSLSTWWAMSDFGICALLSSFFLSKHPDTKRVFAIIIDGKDVTNELKPYMSSIVLDNNLTAAALCDLYFKVIKKVPAKKNEENTVNLVDFELNERDIVGDELLFQVR